MDTEGGRPVNGQDDQPAVKIEDIAVAAMFSALGAVVPELVKSGTPRWIACFGVGACLGAYGTSAYIEFKNRRR